MHAYLAVQSNNGTRMNRMDAITLAPPHASTSSACLPLSEVGVAMWISGPNGAGKTTTTWRLGRYGFTPLDCEDREMWAADCNLRGAAGCNKVPRDWELQSRAMRNATLAALDTGAALSLGTCGPADLLKAPVNVMKVLLLPDHDLYTARWRNREKETRIKLGRPDFVDTQHHEEGYQLFRELLDRAPDQVLRVMDNPDDGPSCVDASLIRLCNAVIHRLATNSDELCFYCQRASKSWKLFSHCSRCEATKRSTSHDLEAHLHRADHSNVTSCHPYCHLRKSDKPSR